MMEDSIESQISISAGAKHLLRVANSKRKFNFKLLGYFEKETPKYTRLKFISGQSIESCLVEKAFNEIFPNSRHPLKELISGCAKLKIFDLETLMDELDEKSYTGFFTYKDFLLRCGALYAKNRLSFQELEMLSHKAPNTISAKLSRKGIEILRRASTKQFGSISNTADNIGVPKQALWNWLSEKSTVPLTVLAKITKILGLGKPNASWIEYFSSKRKIYFFNNSIKSSSLISPFGEDSSNTCDWNLKTRVSADRQAASGRPALMQVCSSNVSESHL